MHSQTAMIARAPDRYRKALDVMQSAVNDSHPDLAHSLAHLAGLQLEAGQLDAARALYEKALDVRHKVHGKLHAAHVPLLHALGCICAKQGALTQAEAWLRRAIRMRHDLNERATSRPLSTVHSATSIASSRHDASAAALAARLAARSSELLPKLSSTCSAAMGAFEADVQLAASLNELGGVLESSERLEEAHEAYQEALDLRITALGETHVDTAVTQENLACVLIELGHPDQAERLLRSSLDVNLLQAQQCAAQGGSTHEEAVKVAALTAYNLGRALEAIGGPTRWQQARDAYQQGLQLAKQHLGTQHDDTKSYQSNWVSCVCVCVFAGNPCLESVHWLHSRMLTSNVDVPVAAASHTCHAAGELHQGRAAIKMSARLNTFVLVKSWM